MMSCLGRLPVVVSRSIEVIPYDIAKRRIHIFSSLSAGQKWRMRHGKSRTGNEYGPLTDLPDWTYTDGRPAVIGKGQLRRKVKQFAFSQRIRRLLDEMDAAKAAGSQSQVATSEQEADLADESYEELDEEVEKQDDEDGGSVEDKDDSAKATQTN